MHGDFLVVWECSSDAGVSDGVDCHTEQGFCMTENEINKENAKVKMEMNDSLVDPKKKK